MYGTPEDAESVFQDLVDRFEKNEKVYRSSAYNEESTRNEFINPFFTALGWDVANKSGAAEQYKDCVHEEGIKIEGVTKAPDYTFRFGGQRKYFVEAKRPSISLKSDAAAAFQLRRYAWNANLPISVLTNFAELAIYDTRIRPKGTDKAPVACIAYFTREDYLAKLPEIWEILSKDAILTGSFDRFAEEEKKHKGKNEVDDAFLCDIELWREMLARNIALRNGTTDVDALNYVVQATIDRIVFLRIAEDRAVEPFGQLRNLLTKSEVYRQLISLYRKADGKYNSGLFDFSADRLSLSLAIDDKPLEHIIDHLYYPKSPYEFSLIPVEILGSVYERFLGKIVRLTAAHHAKIEEKPDVKKAGGVYYTPAYIVEDIVERTVGPLVEGRSPRDLRELRIVDPACGSGSFLIGAYEYLMRHYLNYYESNNPQKRAQEVFRMYLFTGPNERWRQGHEASAGRYPSPRCNAACRCAERS